MTNNSSFNPSSKSEISAVTESVATVVRAHQRKIRALTGVALLLGFLAICASILIVFAYFVLYRPKEIEVLHQVNLVATAKANPQSLEPGTAPQLPFDFPHIQAQMSFFHSMVLLSLSVALGLLALGTLILGTVVILSRRATLQQVTLSLAQISSQLQELQSRQPAR